MRRMHPYIMLFTAFICGVFTQSQLKLAFPNHKDYVASDLKMVKIKRIIDGDSLLGVSNDGFEIDIRLAHIDAPERHQTYGEAATRELERLCLGQKAHISIIDKDSYGRLIAELKCTDIDINQHMLSSGYAWVFDRYNTRLTFPALEQQAAQSCAGLWGAGNAEPPWVFRAKSEDKYKYISPDEIRARTARCTYLKLAAQD